MLINHCATARGSNRTQVPTRNDGMRPAAACLKIVTLDTKRKILNLADYPVSTRLKVQSDDVERAKTIECEAAT